MTDTQDINDYSDSKHFGSIQNIMSNAFEVGDRELTYQQAYSIHLRSTQLTNESKNRPHLISKTEKARQINLCWQRRRA